MVKRKNPGDSALVTSAADWNSVADAADYVARRQRGEPDPQQQHKVPTDVIKVKNDSCGDRRAGEVLAICTHLGLALGCSSLVRFSNENMLVQIEENVREADVFVVQPSCPPVSDGLVELLITLDALKHASAGRITAVLPYFPYARSDKKDRPRISGE